MLPDVVETSLATALVLLAPGYIALLTSNQVRGQRGIDHDLTNAALSVLLSALILSTWYSVGALPSLLNRWFGTSLASFADWDSALHTIIAYPLAGFLTIGGLSVGFGYLIGAGWPIVQQRMLKPGRKRENDKVGTYPSDLWDVAMDEFVHKAVAVYTNDDRVFIGLLSGYSSDEEDHAITVDRAAEVRFENGSEIRGAEVESMLFLGPDIRRVALLPDENQPEQTPSTPSE